MAIAIFLYISKRSQRIVAAVLSLVLIHVFVASCAPEPVSRATHIQVGR
jgi:hypothetical protein